jgi:hypothetical protein
MLCIMYECNIILYKRESGVQFFSRTCWRFNLFNSEKVSKFILSYSIVEIVIYLFKLLQFCG